MNSTNFKIRKNIENEKFGAERALYNLEHCKLQNCKFTGSEDGESALKECRDVAIVGCQFDLRYPLWHAKEFTMLECKMSKTCRAPIWYAQNGEILNSKLHGIKSLRECREININKCDINSAEFAWKCSNVVLKNSKVISEYAFLESDNVTIDNVEVDAKYSFQYMNNLKISDSKLRTKDAFWHSKNVEVVDSVLQGEYLAWYSENLTLRNCTITGTQPFCYCKGLRLINCKMQECDLAFEYAEVEADIVGNIASIKNPKSGKIICDSVDEIIKQDAVVDCNGEIVIR